MSDQVPVGWFTFGYHAPMSPVPPLEFSAQSGEDGLPLWERPLHQCDGEIAWCDDCEAREKDRCVCCGEPVGPARRPYCQPCHDRGCP